MIKIAIFDLDGVLADNRHRLPYVKSPQPNYFGTKEPQPLIEKSWEPNWKKFYSEAVNDTLVQETYQLLVELFDTGWTIFILTGREATEQVKTITKNWLGDNSIYYYRLLMRTEGDHRPDYIMKESAVKTILSFEPDLIVAFDDQIQNIEMFKKNGITAFHTFIKEEK